jgi:enediyne biosynthesis protein E4
MTRFKKYIIACIIVICSLSISCRQKQASNTVFASLDPTETGIHFTNKPASHNLFNILYYLYYYNGGGVATGDINNDGLTDIYFTANNKGGNELYLNKGNFKFEDITAKAGVAGSSDWCTGVTMTDVNSDGLLDIYVSSFSNRYGLKGRNELFINKGNGEFKENAEAYGLATSCFTTQSAFFDYDHDGDLDCFILNQSNNPHANITDTSKRRRYDSLAGDRLYRNDVNGVAGKFIDVSTNAGIYQSNLGYGLGLGIADLNNDGWEDIYIGNDFHENDYYYVNNGNGTFTESGAKHFNHYSRFSMGNDIADYNNDGQLDVVTVDMLPPDEKTLKTYGSDENADTYATKLDRNGYQNQVSRNCLQVNNGNGKTFSDIGLISGISATDWSWGALFADFDNDGKKDLFVSSGIVKRPVDLDYIRYSSDLNLQGMDKTDKFDARAIDAMPDGSSHPFLFRNTGDYSFADVSTEWGTGNMKGYFNGASYADLDNDGNLDLIINCIDAPAVILKNHAPRKKAIAISFKGSSLNRFGIGCKAYVFQDKIIQYQQLMLSRGFQSSSDTKLHFGLDSAAIDSILIVWPDQKYEVIKNVTSNRIEIAEANATGQFLYTSFFPAKKELFENISELVSCNWSHRENNFNDNNIQYLIPHKESTRGPKIAVGDVNKDGLDDFYVCGAKDQQGALMVQQKDGHFMSVDSALFHPFAPTEDVDAVFFDANGDSYPDLFVVSGGNENRMSNPLDDRLFLNDGTGHFKVSVKSLASQPQNKSCISAADIDNDRDMDLFIGGQPAATTFGLPSLSYLYINDGKANFKLADESVIRPISPGMVTASSFIDINNDGWKDLVLAGEWMEVKVFINKNGKFTETGVPQSTGLWQTLYPADINGDGYMDFLAGNWGHNSKLWAGKSGPLKLYVKDFDKNGSVEQILAYTQDGKEYPFLAKDELERAIPVLKKAYLKYSEVAGKTVQYLFYDLFKDYIELKAEVLSSSFFINDGKGNFIRTDLPDELQLAPIMTFGQFDPAKPNLYWAAGNFYGVIPYEGRYDALQPTGFSYDRATSSFKKIYSLPGANGEARDIKWINYTGNKKIMMLARNNKDLLFLKPVTD